MKVPITKTPLSPAEALRLIASAEPNKCAQRILLAQWGVETDGGNSIYNWNWAGLKYVGSGDYFESYTHEVVNNESVRVLAKFQAYETAEQGRDVWLSLIERRYAQALQAARACDVEGFAQELKDRGYYTAPVADYLKGLNYRLNEYRNITGSLGGEPNGPLPNPAPAAGSSSLLESRALPTLSFGAYGLAVAVCQRLLVGLRIDGEFGPKTRIAVREHQKQHNLKIDGIVGPKTWFSLAFNGL